MLNSSKTPEEGEIERREKEKTAQERKMERREKKRASDRAYYARKKAAKAQNSPVLTLEEKSKNLREKLRVAARDYRAKLKESPEEWEAYKERQRERGLAIYAKKKEARLTGIAPSKTRGGIKNLTTLEWAQRYKKRLERKRKVERALYATKKKAREEQQILNSNKTAEEREIEKEKKAEERREKKRARDRASYARRKKALEEQQQILDPDKTPEGTEKEERTCEEREIFKPNKTPEGTEKEETCEEREIFKPNKAPEATEKEETCEEREIFKPNKTPEKRKIEWEKIGARARALMQKALEKQRGVLKSNEIVDGRLEKRAHHTKKMAGRKIVSDTLVEDEITDLVSDLIKRVGNTLEEGSSEFHAKRVKEVCKTAAPVKQIIADHDYAQKSDLKERTEIKYIRKSKVAYVPSYMLKEFKLSLYRSNSLRKGQMGPEKRALQEKNILKPQKTPEESEIERRERIRARDRARYAKKKEARKIEEEVKYLVSDLIKRVDNTLEEESKKLHAKSVKEACETAAPVTQILPDHAQKSDLKKINEIIYLGKTAIAVVPSYGLQQFKSYILRSKPLQDEVLERNRVGILKAIESFLERKAQTERKSQILLTNCSNPAERKTETDPMKVESSKIDIAVGNKHEILDSSKIEIAVTNKNDTDARNNEIAVRKKNGIFSYIQLKSVEERRIERKEKQRAYDRARRKKAREERQLLKTPEEREIERREKEKTAEEREMDKRERKRAREKARHAKIKKARETDSAVSKKILNEREIKRRERKKVRQRALYAKRKIAREELRMQILKHSNNKAGCNENEAAASIELDVERELKKREKEEREIKKRENEEIKRREKEKRSLIRREKNKAYRRAYYARLKKAIEEQQIFQPNKTPEEREKEKKDKERWEKIRAGKRARYARIKKAREEQRILDADKTPEGREKDKRAEERREKRRARDRASYAKKKEARLTQYLLNNCANPAEQNCETGPLKVEKPSLQPVMMQMKVEVEPQQREEPLLTYVRKEIEPLMPCIDEEHSEHVKIKTEPEELQETEESLFSYVSKEFMHFMRCMKEEHSQPETIVTKPEELQPIEESLLNFVDEEFVPVTSCIEENEQSDSKTSTSSIIKNLS